jgi:hypothetical protein
MKRKNKIKSKAGRIGGSATTKAKRIAAIRNGAKGGRPRKIAVKKIDVKKPDKMSDSFTVKTRNSV